MTTATMRSEARVPTEKAGRYMAQLCKHFAHKIPATFDHEAGRIEFAFGVCRLRAGPDSLALEVEGADEPALDRLEEVVASHLERFAFREPLKVAWTRI
jgi:hypothetical protein